MKCPVCDNELKFDDENYLNNDVYSEEITVRQWWHCPECNYNYDVIRHYSQDDISCFVIV